MSAAASSISTLMLAEATLPPLENGDRLTRKEFRRRWKATPRVHRAELINGVVYLMAPLRHVQHGRPHSTLNAWLTHYAAHLRELDYSDAASVGLDDFNEPQPDLLLRIPEANGGRSRVTADGYIEGPPEFIAEVAASSASYDLHDKLNTYRQFGVQEYLIWRVADRAVDWYELQGPNYVPLASGDDGIVKSKAFPGMWLNTAALLSGDLLALFRTVEAGTRSPEFTQFAARFQS